jgi:anti-sigma B factor antagonist
MPAVQVSPDSITAHAIDRSAFVCSSTEGDSVVAWVHVAGELDMATAPRLERTLRERLLHARLVVLDLREVTFMDTCGVYAIIDASSRARQRGRRLVILRGPPSVDRMITLTGSSDALEISDVDWQRPPARELVPRAAGDRAA